MQIRLLQMLLIGVLGLGAYIIFSSSCVPKGGFSVSGFLFGRPLLTTVDDTLAGLMLTNPQDNRVVNLFASYQDKPLDTKTLSHIAANYSTDVATFYFLQKEYQNENNKQAQDLYAANLDLLSLGDNMSELNLLKDYYVAFVPGLAYNDTSNGGNFARQRRLLTSAGIANEMIVTDDWGMSDDNAAIVAARLRELSILHEKIIVVSASKGGLETALALGKILKPEETKPIKAWVSVGGVLRGSPVADTFLCWPKCWIAEIGLMTKGKKINLLQDVSYKKREQEYKQLPFPDSIKIIHFVGAPMATMINKDIRGLYCSIKSLGPNDGLTPLADEVTANGIVVSEVGLDHHYRDPNIDKKTIALALVIAQIEN
ncbi:MAG: hypothetical protein ABIO46_08360 [Chitinophagales bacterium]